MKIIHTADWHVGPQTGPELDGVNLREKDTEICIEKIIDTAEKEHPELVLVSGDIFHVGKTWGDRQSREVITVRRAISRIKAASGCVIVMRGTPNHDGYGQFELLKEFFADIPDVWVIDRPQVIKTKWADIAMIPGFEHGEYRAKCPGAGKEEESEIFTRELANIVMGLRAECAEDKPAILMAHYTVPGSDMNSSHSQLLSKIEPVLSRESLDAARYDLICLGHIHKPQMVGEHIFYPGSINTISFNDEGQDKGFWLHEVDADLPFENISSKFIETPYRELITLHFDDADITEINNGNLEEVAMNRWQQDGAVKGKMVRVLYQCSSENKKALNTALVQKRLYEDGAFYVTGITPERIEATADKTDLSHQTDPEENLCMYLREKNLDSEEIDRLIEKARPIISQVLVNSSVAVFSGIFRPIEIEVKNYRAYAEEQFNFSDIQFCTINGQNGAGKSSLFMDAIIDCIYEEPREGKSTSVKVPWLRNDEGVRSGYIAFTFAIGDKKYRITRTRVKSGSITLNLAELVEGEWQDRSCEKANDTQTEIEKLIGVDSVTFKSCALIMQDQYGLFLQAKKDERMIVLGNLLGLGIYGEMEGIAKDKAVELGRIIGAKKQNIKIQAENILNAGKPDEELHRAETKQKNIDQQLLSKNAEKEKVVTLLNTKKLSLDRLNELTTGINTLEQKKRNTEQNKNQLEATIYECDGIIDNEENILSCVSRYRDLVEKEKQLIEGSTIYRQKFAESVKLQEQIRLAEIEIEKYKQDLDRLNGLLGEVASEEDWHEVEKKAIEYFQKKEELDKLFSLSQSYHQLCENGFQKACGLDSKLAYYNELLRELLGEQAALERKALLLTDSGCIDLDNAKCRFLTDAIEAKSLLLDYPDKLEALEVAKNKEIDSLERELKEVERVRDELGYSELALEELKQECEKLKVYETRFRKLQEQEREIAVIRASITNTQSNISNTTERLSTLKLRVIETEAELEKYADCFRMHSSVVVEVKVLEVYLDKEKNLLIAKERKVTAEERLTEIAIEIAGIDTEIGEKQEQANAEAEKAKGIKELEESVHFIQCDIDSLSNDSKNNQIHIGGLKQKIEEVQRMKAAIKVMQEEIAEMADEATAYDTLKLAFSQDGIPHQIIRTVIPKLSSAANNILGQMTGGQLGVDFVTEKVLKSNNKKEVVTLDIFIEEFGKSNLPYLSKSGGEKVKASLAVVLALAEVKASTAGIQFGMLFIDEPPFLDADGIQAYCDALEIIQERYPSIKVMAITHDPTMKSRFPQSVDVVKTEHGSKIIF